MPNAVTATIYKRIIQFTWDAFGDKHTEWHVCRKYDIKEFSRSLEQLFWFSALSTSLYITGRFRLVFYFSTQGIDGHEKNH